LGGFINPYQLTSLAFLPPNLQYLDCHGNGISSLQNLPASLTYLNCASNRFHSSQGVDIPTLTSIGTLPASLAYLNCSGNGISTLPALPATLTYLDASNNYADFTWLSNPWFFSGITSLPTLPSNLGYLNVSNNPSLFCLPILPMTLTTLNITVTGINCIPNLVPGLNIGSTPICTQANDTYGCGPFPRLTVSLTSISGNAVSGSPGTVASYNLTARYLDPASGNISVSATPLLELSLDNINFSNTALSIPYTGSTLSSTVIYARISASALPGAFTGTITHSGGSANDVTVAFSGTVIPSFSYIWVPDVISGLNSLPGEPSNSVSYSLRGANLAPASGSITITPSALLEVSTDNTNFTAAPLSVGYSNGQITKTLYVRISNAAPSGAFTGTLTHVGGSAADTTSNVNGTVARHYYNTKANLGLNNAGTWSTTTDGTGPSPANISDPNIVFNLIEPDNVGYTGSWNLSQVNNKIIVGDGTVPLMFVINDPVTWGVKIDVKNNATLKILSKQYPVLNNLDDGSTINFAYPGTNASTDQISIPARSYYNLTLTNGIKYLGSGTGFVITVRNNFVADGASIEVYNDYLGTRPLNCFGDVSFLNGCRFDGLVNGSNKPMALKMNGPGPVQRLITNGPWPVEFNYLMRDSATACNIIVTPNTNLVTRSGIRMMYANATLSTTGGKISFIQNGRFNAADLGKFNSDGTSFEFLMAGATSQGPFRLTPNSTIKHLKADFNPANNANWDHINIDESITITDTLTLTRGRVFVNNGYTLNLPSTATIIGGNTSSFVEGVLQRTGNTDLLYPIGNGYGIYRPLRMKFLAGNSGGTYAAQYRKAGYGNYTIDPGTQSSFTGYQVSNVEYWNITPAAAGTVDSITFNYNDANSQITDPLNMRMAHFDGTDWNDVAGIPGVSNTTTAGNITITGVSTFSLFTFSSATGVVVPVKVSSFSARKQQTNVQLNWTTEQEINSQSFTIERSVDGIKWISLASIAAAGNSQVKRNYQAIDYHPAKGINYYRLKEVDMDGRFTVSETRSVYFDNDVQLVLAPNPVTNKVTIYIPGNTSSVSIKIFNTQGQLMKTVFSNEETIPVNITGFARGVYSVKVIGKNMEEVRKMVVE
jgi:hypothetical protein